MTSHRQYKARMCVCLFVAQEVEARDNGTSVIKEAGYRGDKASVSLEDAKRCSHR